jgi:phosphate transport system permease protein
MTIDVRTPIAAVPAAAAAEPRRDIRIRPRSFQPADALPLAASLVASFCLVWLLYVGLTPLSGWVGFAVWWYLAFLTMYWLAVRRLSGSLLAKDRLMTAVVTSVAVAMAVPLVLIIGDVIYQGVGVITWHFFVQTVQQCGQLDPATCGGVGHAIIGTLEEVGLALVIAVPLAVLCAVFLNEIGGPLKRPVRIFVDAMSGVPSIVAGLFIYAAWVVGLNQHFSGFAASLALSILMLPTVTRTGEEVLRLVPDGLREGALALGASEWRTVWNVVLPTARSGLITAVLLGVARSVGETAPLLVTAFGSSDYNVNHLSGNQEALPQFVYTYIRFNPGTGPYQRAWGAAAVLIVLVLALFTAARVIGARTSIEGRQRRAANRMNRAPTTPAAVSA